MSAKVIWDHGLTFTGTADSGFEVPLGTSASVGGDEDGFRPMELIATGLAGCTAMDVISILSKMRQVVTAFVVAVLTENASEHPRVFTHATIEYHVTGCALNEEMVKRAIELSAVRYCPAQAMLGKVMSIGIKYFLYEGESAESRQLVKEADFSPV